MAVARAGLRSLSALKIIRPISSQVRCFCSTPEKVTHTGQQYDEQDWRKVRFIDKQKTVDPFFAEEMIAEEAPIEVTERITSCNGGGGALGHPKVFINVDKPGAHSCGYCGLRFIRKSHH